MILENRKNLLLGIIAIIFILAVYQFFYLPKYKEMKSLRTDAKKITNDIEELYAFVGGKEKLQENIITVKDRVEDMEKEFPLEKEISGVIKQLNEKAKSFKVNIISLKPKDVSVYRDKENKEVMIGDYFCKRLPLYLELEAEYKALGEFLMDTENNISPKITIENVKIDKAEDNASRLRVRLEISAFMMGK